MFDMYDALLDPCGYVKREVLKNIKPSKGIVHQKTCPVCGAHLVNLYKRNGEWKCKKCWDKN